MPTSAIERTYPNMLPFSLSMRSITLYLSVEIVYPRLAVDPVPFRSSFTLDPFYKGNCAQYFMRPHNLYYMSLRAMGYILVE